jgi:hypothetical protein
LLERTGVPTPAVVLVIPDEHVVFRASSGDRKGELITVPRVSEEQEGIEGM